MQTSSFWMQQCIPWSQAVASPLPPRQLRGYQLHSQRVALSLSYLGPSSLQLSVSSTLNVTPSQSQSRDRQRSRWKPGKKLMNFKGRIIISMEQSWFRSIESWFRSIESWFRSIGWGAHSPQQERYHAVARICDCPYAALRVLLWLTLRSQCQRPLGFSSFWMHNASSLMQLSSFKIHKSSFLIQESNAHLPWI